MNKLVYILMAMILCIACSHKKQSKAKDIKDSIVTVYAMGEELEIPLDSFLQIKDSFVYVEHDECCIPSSFWVTKEYYKWNYGYPDTITVAFTRNGKFEDSVQAVRRGVVYDKNGKAYSPAYVYFAVVGDNWTYDVNGKFIEFNCTIRPHSGRPHHYNP